jgi:hypothetical protein
LKAPYVKDEEKENKKDKNKPLHVFYADFECSTDNIHKAFNICYSSPNLLISGSIWGEDCGKEFLEVVPDKSLIYFHNLSYDINFIVKELVELKNPQELLDNICLYLKKYNIHPYFLLRDKRDDLFLYNKNI